MKKYQSTGVVLGKLWGGGFSYYPAEKLFAPTKEELIRKAKTLLEEGSLDDGMGFEYLKCAILHIKETETIVKNKKVYHRAEFEKVYIGDVDEQIKIDMKEFLRHYQRR